jgi:hypothetical protein
MTNNSNPLEPAKIVKTITPLEGGKFDLVSLSRNTDKDNRLVSKSNFIAIIPFERNEEDKISYIYAVKFQNHAIDQSDVSLLVDTLDSERDSTAYDSVGRALLEEAGLNIDEIGVTEDDLFYLGPMTFSEPISAKFKCYAIDLTKVVRPDEQLEFTTTLAKSPFTRGESEIVRLGFHQVVNGDYPDVTILAGAFLLVSYFA